MTMSVNLHSPTKATSHYSGISNWITIEDADGNSVTLFVKGVGFAIQLRDILSQHITDECNRIEAKEAETVDGQ